MLLLHIIYISHFVTYKAHRHEKHLSFKFFGVGFFFLDGNYMQGTELEMQQPHIHLRSDPPGFCKLEDISTTCLRQPQDHDPIKQPVPLPSDRLSRVNSDLQPNSICRHSGPTYMYVHAHKYASSSAAGRCLASRGQRQWAGINITPCPWLSMQRRGTRA